MTSLVVLVLLDLINRVNRFLMKSDRNSPKYFVSSIKFVNTIPPYLKSNYGSRVANYKFSLLPRSLPGIPFYLTTRCF